VVLEPLSGVAVLDEPDGALELSVLDCAYT
jgi:hypothetical protein